MLTCRVPLLHRIFAACVILPGCASALAQAYPVKPIHWIIPFAPGGNLDLLTRGLAPPLASALGQPIVPENRPASNGNAAAEYTAKAAPDGYILLTAGAAALMYAKLIYPGLQYDPERDFARITRLAKSPIALFVNGALPVGSYKEFIAYAKSQNGKLNYGAAGHGHPFHLAMELLMRRTGFEMLFVPYKGAAPVVQDTVAGRLHATFFTSSEQMAGLVGSGKLRALASATDRRLRTLPDVPTFDELGIGDLQVSGTIALFAPGGTSREIVMRLNREIVRIVTTPDLGKLYEGLSLLPWTSTPEELAEQQRREYQAWAPLIRSLGIKAE